MNSDSPLISIVTSGSGWPLVLVVYVVVLVGVVPLRGDRSSRHRERVADRRHVVDPEDARAALVREHVGGDRRGDPVVDVAAGDRAEERLARGADHERAADRDELVEPPQQLEVVLDRLAEADPGIEHDPPPSMPRAIANARRSSRNALMSSTTSS